MRRAHLTLFSPRKQDAGWGVLQSYSLLQEAIRNGNNPSFLMYSAFEMRNAIEQVMFTIIAACCIPNSPPPEVIARCKKKDGLFMVLPEYEPKYTLMCQFANALTAEEPRIPKVAEWDVKILIKRWQALSAYCHSPLIMTETATPKWFSEGQVLLEECYDYMAAQLKRGTAYVNLSDLKPPIVKQLWDDFCDKKITVEQVIIRLRLMKPLFPTAWSTPTNITRH